MATVALAINCPGLLDLAEISSRYAQLTGLLAGFAFTAIVVLLTPTQIEERRKAAEAGDATDETGVLLTLLAAFVALIICSLVYSVLAGETESAAHGRAASLELINGVPFGLATIMLFRGLALLLHAGHVEAIAVWVGCVLTVVIAPTLTMYYISSGASDSATARSANAGHCISPGPSTLGIVLSLVLLVVLSAAVVPRWHPTPATTWVPKLRAGPPLLVSDAVLVEDGVCPRRRWW